MFVLMAVLFFAVSWAFVKVPEAMTLEYAINMVGLDRTAIPRR